MENTKKKKTIWIGSFLLLVFCAAGNVLYQTNREAMQEQEHKSSIRIGVSAYKQSDTFISTILEAMSDLAKQYEQEGNIKINLDITDAKGNQNLQNQQIEHYISLNYDVICVNIVDRTNAAVMIDKAIDAEIPMIFFNREPVEEDIFRGEQIYYVGSDARQSAVLEGELIVEAYERDPGKLDRNGDGVLQYVMLEGEAGHQDALIRTQWSVQTLLDYGIRIEKLAGGVANWEKNQAAELMKQWYHQYGDQIELVICNNDDMAIGAADTLEEAGMTDICITGIDGTPQGLKAVEEHRLLGTVQANGPEHAAAVLDLACSLTVTGQAPENIGMENKRYIRIQLDKVSK
ncbi:galactose ABC transporter substrate-binding protein [Diplocloster hominis]|uniref:galactose ABC transporter substrate-binding protein n=1 Tax=Diplocloster hominis TaxID=3079010 RepID=UPI0031BB6D07